MLVALNFADWICFDIETHKLPGIEFHQLLERNGSAAEVVQYIAMVAAGSEFASRAGQIGYSVTSASPPLRRLFGAASSWR